MRILVTGGSGQLAQCIHSSVSKYDNSNVYFFVSHREMDIANYTSVCSKLAEINPNIVINCAAYVKTDKAEEDSLNAYLANAMGPTYLAIECKARNIELIHISTECVFDGTKPTAYTADDKCNPLNVYGATKYCGEEAIKAIYPEAIIIRTSWLYSEYGDNFLTKTLKNIKSAHAGNKELKYLIDQIGCPTYARNLADFIVKDLIVAQKDAKVRTRTIYHYTDDGIASRYDFAKAIERYVYHLTNNNYESVISGCNSDEFVEKIKRPKCCILSKKELVEEFNVKLKDWRESLLDCASHLGPIPADFDVFAEENK